MNSFLDHVSHAFELPLSNPVLIFGIILFIILVSPILLGKVKIPGIIGLIISGMIIGPYGLGWLEKSSAIDLFSTIGLLYIMFIAGLELDLEGFQKNKYKSLVFGILTFIIPLSIGIPVCYYFLGYPMNASILTASMFSTHTLVAYPIVSKFGISRNEAVAITVGGTILTDTAVLLILAVIVGAESGGLTTQFWIGLITSLTIFSAIMFVVVPRIASWFFSKLESEKTSHYVFVLSVVFFAAFMAELAGVEPIIGSFVAGLALNPLIPHSSVLMNRLEFVGNALFIPFFLISVGMIVDISVVFNGMGAIIVATTLTVVSLFGKYLAAFFTAFIYKYSKAQRLLIFGLSSSHAAATLAIILIGYKLNIIDENILNGTIILILVTCIVASFATESASKKIVQDESGPAQTLTDANDLARSEHLLVPVANFNNIDTLLELAILIKSKESTNPISMLSVVPNDQEAENNVTQVKKKLESSLQMASASEISVQAIATIDYNIASGIVRTAKEIQANIIVLGWPRKTSLIDRFFGPKTENIVERTDKNIFITHTMYALSTHKRLVVFLPPFVEREMGFKLIMQKAFVMAKELSLRVVFYCKGRTQLAVNESVDEFGIMTSIQFQQITLAEDFLKIKDELQQEDILMVIGARKNTASYNNYMESIPRRLDKHFSENSVLLIYPQVDGVELENISIGTTL